MKKSVLLKITAVLLVLAAVLAPALFLALESGHECNGGDCDICKTIALCKDISRILFVLYAFLFVMSGLRACDSLCAETADFLKKNTPVCLKVKLLN